MKKKYVVAAVVILVVIVVASAGCYIGLLGSLSTDVDGIKVLKTSDDSMAPTIKMDAQVTYNITVPFSSLQLDDVIVFHKAHETGTFIGRIVNATVNGLIVKGDNNIRVYLGYLTEGLYAGKVERIDNPP
jgi:hypothetical protein